MRGTLWGIGVGPGDPELLTLKALNCIKASDTILLPAEPKEECYAYRIVQAVYPEIDQKEIICLNFPMIKNPEELSEIHERIYKQTAAILEQGKSAAFLTIGDPTVYSTYSYIHEKELKNNGNAQMINGVPSFCAAAAAMGISLAGSREQIHIIPASFDIEETLGLKGTRIYMKSGKNLEKLKQTLLKQKDENKYMVYNISNCGMEEEKLTMGAEQIDSTGGYLTIVIVKEAK